MSTYVYLEAESRATVRRWFETEGQGQSVKLLLAESDTSHANKLKELFGNQVKEQIIIPSSADSVTQSLDHNEVVVPMRFDTLKTRRAGSLMIPAIHKRMEPFRKLWLLGFREFNLFSLSGSRTLMIPHLLDGMINKHKDKRQRKLQKTI